MGVGVNKSKWYFLNGKNKGGLIKWGTGERVKWEKYKEGRGKEIGVKQAPISCIFIETLLCTEGGNQLSPSTSSIIVPCEEDFK